MADKLIALPASQNYIRYRDLWDLAWLVQQGAKMNIEYVQNKTNDYQLDNYTLLLADRINSIEELVRSNRFSDEMKRFIPSDIYQRTLSQPKFKDYLVYTLQKLFSDVSRALSGVAENTPKYQM